MRGVCLILAILVVVCALGLGQQSNNPPSSAATAASTPTKLTGCLMNMNGTFYLLTANQERFMLKGKHSSMFNHNGQQVEITVKPAKESSTQGSPVTLTVTHIEQLAQVCR
jgi:hypothetical protein